MQVLVIGGSRFIGLAVVQRLLMDGHRITLVNRGRTADPFGTRVSRVIGDRSDPQTLQRALARREFDAVIDVIAFREEDTRAAIEKLSGRIGHFIHISTASVYLVRERLLAPFREEDFAGRLAPKTEATSSSWTYAYHKRRCEVALAHAWDGEQFPYTTLRLPMVVGPRDYTERAQTYFERLLDGGPVILPDGGLDKLLERHDLPLGEVVGPSERVGVHQVGGDRVGHVPDPEEPPRVEPAVRQDDRAAVQQALEVRLRPLGVVTRPHDHRQAQRGVGELFAVPCVGKRDLAAPLVVGVGPRRAGGLGLRREPPGEVLLTERGQQALAHQVHRSRGDVDEVPDAARELLDRRPRVLLAEGDD